MIKNKYLPTNFENLTIAAVEKFWASKLNKNVKTLQGGSRDTVTSGQHMNGFNDIFIEVAKAAGAPEESIITSGSLLKLPGYFRASKKWDGIIYHNGKLIAAVEFKSQAGSFGNNQNNRIEEVLGLGLDFWTAEKHGFLGNSPDTPSSDPRPPFIGYLMLLEASDKSQKKMSPNLKTFPIDSEFTKASYADRYLIAANRLVSERIFNSVSIMISKKAKQGAAEYSSMSTITSVTTFFTALAAHISTHIDQ